MRKKINGNIGLLYRHYGDEPDCTPSRLYLGYIFQVIFSPRYKRGKCDLATEIQRKFCTCILGTKKYIKIDALQKLEYVLK